MQALVIEIQPVTGRTVPRINYINRIDVSHEIGKAQSSYRAAKSMATTTHCSGCHEYATRTITLPSTV